MRYTTIQCKGQGPSRPCSAGFPRPSQAAALVNQDTKFGMFFTLEICRAQRELRTPDYKTSYKSFASCFMLFLGFHGNPFRLSICLTYGVCCYSKSLRRSKRHECKVQSEPRFSHKCIYGSIGRLERKSGTANQIDVSCIHPRTACSQN